MLVKRNMNIYPDASKYSTFAKKSKMKKQQRFKSVSLTFEFGRFTLFRL